MNESAFKKKLMRGDLLVGTMVTLPTPEIAEIFCLTGFDWLFVDLEHSALTLTDAQRIMQTVAPQIPCLLRVPVNDEAWINRALDTGPSGIVVPQIRTAEDAEKAVRFCKYPPYGSRGVGIGRAQGYGEAFDEYIASANSQIAVVVQIEHIDAVNNIDKIVGVSGIDCLFVGPYDLSGSMGKIGAVTDADVQEAVSHVTECAAGANIPLGIFGATVDAVQPYIQRKYSLIAVALDVTLIASAAKSIIQLLK